MPNYKRTPWRERFWAFCPPEARQRDDGCWEWWGGSRFNLRPVHGGNSYTVAPRRASWLASGRNIKKGQVVYNTCLNRWCVNPEHLAVGRMGDALVGRMVSPWGRGLDHPRAKLSDEDVEQIRRLAALGHLQKDIAAHFDVHPATVQGIVAGRRRLAFT